MLTEESQYQRLRMKIYDFSVFQLGVMSIGAFLFPYYAMMRESYGYFSLLLVPFYVGSFLSLFILSLVFWLMQRMSPQTERRRHLQSRVMQSALIACMIIGWILWNLRRDEGADQLEVVALGFLVIMEIFVVMIHNRALAYESITE